jgi:hypothetical protein
MFDCAPVVDDRDALVGNYHSGGFTGNERIASFSTFRLPRFEGRRLG